MPTAGWIGGPGTTMAVLNRNPLSRNKGNPATPPIVFIYELKHDLNLYLRDWAVETRIKTLADIIAFNGRTPTRRCASARTSSSPPTSPAAI